MKKFLMMSGMLAAVVYVGTVILGGILRPGYSHMAEAISELVAVDAPNRPLLSSLFLLYNALVAFFGLGLFLKARSELRGRVSGLIGSLALAVPVGISGLLMELFFPQDPGGLPTTTAGTVHIVLAGIASAGTMVAIAALGLWFRNLPALKGYVTYSFITVALVFASGALTAAALASNHPLFGVSERITIGAFILWLFIVGLQMYRRESEEYA